MEKLRQKKYQVAGAIGLGAVVLAGSRVAASASPETQVRTQQPAVSYEQTPRVIQEVSRDFERQELRRALAKSVTAQLAEVAKSKKVPAPKAVAPVQSNGHSTESSKDGFWFGRNDYYNGLLWKAKNAPHEQDVIDNAKLFYTMAKKAGFSDVEVGCGDDILYPESGFWEKAANAHGAFGIPQADPGSKIAKYGPITDPVSQIEFFIHYVGGSDHDNMKGAYSSVCSALDFRLVHNWY